MLTSVDDELRNSILESILGVNRDYYYTLEVKISQ